MSEPKTIEQRLETLERDMSDLQEVPGSMWASIIPATGAALALVAVGLHFASRTFTGCFWSILLFVYLANWSIKNWQRRITLSVRVRRAMERGECDTSAQTAAKIKAAIDGWPSKPKPPGIEYIREGFDPVERP